MKTPRNPRNARIELALTVTIFTCIATVILVIQAGLWNTGDTDPHPTPAATTVPGITYPDLDCPADIWGLDPLSDIKRDLSPWPGCHND